MDFSVIVPAYNRAHLIGSTLEAIFAQTLAPAEVIVVDDGSTDGTAEVASRQDGCRLIRLENGGAANARHVGVQASSGEWIAFCDSDDVWRPDHLATLAAAFEIAPGADFAFSNFVHIAGQTWVTETKFDQAPAGYWRRFASPAPFVFLAEQPVFKDILLFQPIFPSCTAMSRRFYDAVGGYDPAFGRLPSEDLEFTLRCVSRAPVLAVRKATVGIRRHSGNHSGNQMKQLCGEVEILGCVRSRPGLPSDWAAAIDAQIAERAGQAVDAAFAAGDWERVRTMAAHLPQGVRPSKRAVKVALARVPFGLAEPLRRRLSSTGRANTP